MTREDIVKVDELKEALTGAFRSFEHSLRNVFGEMVYAVDTVVDRYNGLEAKHAQLEAHLDAVSERLLALERGSGEH